MSISIKNNEVVKYNNGKQIILNNCDASCVYILPSNKVYKMISTTDEFEIFKFNKHQGEFNKKLSSVNKSYIDETDTSNICTKEIFYDKVLDIIKRRLLIGYMVKTYKHKLDELDFSHIYISPETHKRILANLICCKTGQPFSIMDVSALTENITRRTKVSDRLSIYVTKALSKTIYNNIEFKTPDDKTDFINKIVEKEINKQSLSLTDPEVWDEEYFKLINERKQTLLLSEYIKQQKQLLSR